MQHEHDPGRLEAFRRQDIILAIGRDDSSCENNQHLSAALWDKGIGKEIESGKASFESLQQYILKKGEAEPNQSARQEYLENLFNSYC